MKAATAQLLAVLMSVAHGAVWVLGSRWQPTLNALQRAAHHPLFVPTMASA